MTDNEAPKATGIFIAFEFVNGLSPEWEAGWLWMTKHSQFNVILSELLVSALEVDDSSSTIDWDVSSKSNNAVELAAQFWRELLKADEEREKSEANRYEPAMPWTKREWPAWLSEYVGWSSVDRNRLAVVAQSYIDSGLSSAVLEWALVDSIVYTVIRDLAVDIDKSAPISDDPLFDVPKIYYPSDVKPTEAILGIAKTLAKGALWFSIPVFAGYQYISGEFPIASLVGGLAWLIVSLGWRPYWVSKGLLPKNHALLDIWKRKVKKHISLWNAYDTFDLETPPGLLRRRLENIDDGSVGIPQVIYAILTHAESRNPVQWGQPSLKKYIGSFGNENEYEDIWDRRERNNCPEELQLAIHIAKHFQSRD